MDWIFHSPYPIAQIFSALKMSCLVGLICWKFVSRDFNDCVEKSNLLIRSASSVCMETLAKGIPVIILVTAMAWPKIPFRKPSPKISGNYVTPRRRSQKPFSFIKTALLKRLKSMRRSEKESAKNILSRWQGKVGGSFWGCKRVRWLMSKFKCQIPEKTGRDI